METILAPCTPALYLRSLTLRRVRKAGFILAGKLTGGSGAVVAESRGVFQMRKSVMSAE
jgi:hypothetical protein